MGLLVTAWGLLPLTWGMGLIFHPRWTLKLQKKYAKLPKRLQKKISKAHRASGLFLFLVGFVILLTYFYPVWIYNFFLVTRVLYLMVFPEKGALPVQTEFSEIIPTYWI
ncbi:MAG: hypothetical protein HYT76_00325 [Deltaproteobacteria bacterium]|nr:hypothetical protein [Deltaproteobacteria bacterium]